MTELLPAWQRSIQVTAEAAFKPVVEGIENAKVCFASAKRHCMPYIEIRQEEDAIIAGITFQVRTNGSVQVLADISKEESGEVLKEFSQVTVDDPSLDVLEGLVPLFAKLLGEELPGLISK